MYKKTSKTLGFQKSMTMLSFLFNFSFLLLFSNCIQFDHISDSKLMLTLQGRNKKINHQIIFDDSPLILDFAGTKQIAQINHRYKELLETTNITAQIIADRFKHDKRVINIATYCPLNLLHHLYQELNCTVMMRGRAYTKDKVFASYLSLKTCSIMAGEIKYFVCFFAKNGRIAYAIEANTHNIKFIKRDDAGAKLIFEFLHSDIKD